MFYKAALVLYTLLGIGTSSKDDCNYTYDYTDDRWSRASMATTDTCYHIPLFWLVLDISYPLFTFDGMGYFFI